MKTLTYRLFASFLVVVFFLLPLQGAAAQDARPAGGQPVAPLVPETTLSAIYFTNLIPDGDAEVPYAPYYWVDNEGFTQIVAYGASCGGSCGFPSPYDPGPVLRGQNFFYMGHTTNHSAGNNLWLKNKIDVTVIHSAISSGRVHYILSGYFGGQTTQIDAAQLQMFFENSSGGSAGTSVIVGNVSPAQRQYQTGLVYREITGTLPPGTQLINLSLQSGALSGSDYRTGFADNLSLILLPVQNFLPLLTASQTTKPTQTGYPIPTNVLALPDGLTRMDIYWTDNTNNELGFEVQRINADSSVDTICNTRPNVTYCLDPGFSHSTGSGYTYLGSQKTYTYQVRTVGPGLNSAWASGSGTTATMPLTPPSLTYGGFTCQAIDVSSTSATFVWNDPFNYESGFNIYVGSNTTASWTMLEGGAKISFINQNPGGTIQLKMVPFVYNPTNPAYVYESGTSCTATANLPGLQGSGVTRFNNNASYPVISLVVDGWEQFPVRPLGILSGAYYELDGVPAGQHTWTATTGFWDDYGQRFAMYNYTGSYTQPASGSFSVSIPDMTIQNLLSVPPTNLGYWEGYYFDATANCYTVAFKFKQNGTYTYYRSNTQIDTGTYSLVQHEPAIFSTKFRVTDTGGSLDGLLIETGGMFYMNTGPASWPQVTFVYKPQGYVHNPFCP